MGWTVTSAPASEPLTTSEVKNYLKVDVSTDDSLIGILIESARQYAEKYLNLALITQTIKETFRDFPNTDYTNPDAKIVLSVAPVQSITSITYLDSDGVRQTLSSSAYVTDLVNKPVIIEPAYSTPWPTAREELGSIEITYDAGYGANATDVPGIIRKAMLSAIAESYDNRENFVKKFPTHVEDLLNKYRVFNAL